MFELLEQPITADGLVGENTTRRYDFKKELVYKASTEPKLVVVPSMLFIAVDGEGAPEDNPDFETAMRILYGTIYTIKFWGKKYPVPVDYGTFTITPLEALWWTKDGSPINLTKPTDWRWRAMIRVPEFVTPIFFRDVIQAVITTKHSLIYKKAKLIRFGEGPSVQLLHIGPYNLEDSNINKMHEYIRMHGYLPRGKHHELYFSDPRRTAPEKLRTLLRQPVAAL